MKEVVEQIWICNTWEFFLWCIVIALILRMMKEIIFYKKTCK